MRYAFTHPFREIFTDLQHGVNALVHPGDTASSPEGGSTVQLAPGDELETKTAYVHPHLELIDDAVSEAAGMLANVQKTDVVTDLAAALRAERTADSAGHEAQPDQTQAAPQAAPVSPPAVPQVPATPAPTAATPTVDTPAAPAAPAQAPAPAPAAAPAPTSAPAAPEAPAAS